MRKPSAVVAACGVVFAPFLVAMPARAVTIQYTDAAGGGRESFTSVANLAACSDTIAGNFQALTEEHCVAGVSENAKLQPVLTPQFPPPAFYTSAYNIGFIDTVTGVRFTPRTGPWGAVNPPGEPLVFHSANLDPVPASTGPPRCRFDYCGYFMDGHASAAVSGSMPRGYPVALAGTRGAQRAIANTAWGSFAQLVASLEDTVGPASVADSSRLSHDSRNPISLLPFDTFVRALSLPIQKVQWNGRGDLSDPFRNRAAPIRAPDSGTWSLTAVGILLILLSGRRRIR